MKGTKRMGYNSRLVTPLKFHNFNRYFAIPFSIVCFSMLFFLCIIILITRTVYPFSEYDLYDNTYLINCITTLACCNITLGLLIPAFIGLMRWKFYGFICLMIYLGIQLVCGIILIFIYVDLTLQILFFIYVLAKLIYSVLVYFYYNKRKLLFASNFNDPYIIVPKTEVSVQENTRLGQKYEPMTYQPNLKYCHKCGAILSPESRFCMNCGMEINIPEEKIDSDTAAEN